MAGQQRLAAEFLRQFEQIGELDRLVAFDARHRRLAAGIAVGKRIDHRGAKARFHVDDIMGDAEPVGDGAGIADIGAGAAGARPRRGGAAVVKLQGDANHFAAGFGGERCDHR